MVGGELQRLLDALRIAGSDPDRLAEVVGSSIQRLAREPEHRVAMRSELRERLSPARSTHAFTEVGLLSDEGIAEGVLRRLGERVAPAPAAGDVLEDVLRQSLRGRDRRWLSRLDESQLCAWLEALGVNDEKWHDPAELASALVILATRVAGAGMDARLSSRMPSLEAWSSPFLELSRAVDEFAADVATTGVLDRREAAVDVVERCRDQVRDLREAKKSMGTTLRLSSASLRMLQQLDRLRLLMDCASPGHRVPALARLALDLGQEVCRAQPIGHFVRQKLDLVAYLVIGHAAQKGAQYAVRTSAEYRAFWFKSMLGGFLVAGFASLKLHLGHENLAPVPQALIYGANYAVCFALIFLLGATLATKQPALTASRLADALAGGPGYSPLFVERVRAIWRSQFVSFLGNIIGAGVFTIAFAFAFERATGRALIGDAEAQKLAAKLHPWRSGTLIYAAVAGVMLSAAGFIAGYIDNAMVFHKVGDRVRSGGGIFRLVPGARLREQLAGRIEAKAGALSGNVILGFMLGSAGAFGAILGIPFDIRHIAFGSSHAALSVWQVPSAFGYVDVALLLLSVSCIGLINFLVSFSITLAVAINARRLEGVDWRAQLAHLWRLMRAEPLSFLLPRS